MVDMKSECSTTYSLYAKPVFYRFLEFTESLIKISGESAK